MAPSATLFALPALLLLLAAGQRPASAQATFTVNSALDEVDAVPGDGSCASAGAVCTLRAAIGEANALAGADTVVVPEGTYALSIGGTNEDQNANGDLDIRSDLTIRGLGAGATISAAGLTNQRVMDVPVLANVALKNLTLTGALLTGTTSTSAGAGLRAMAGAVVTMEDCVVTGNTTADEGAGIYATGAGTTVTVLRCVISNNTINGATGFGGGLRTAVSASLNVIETTVSGNTSTAAGGGLNHGTSGGTTVIDRSLFVNNTAISQNTGGGAVSCGGPCHVVNSTFSGNSVVHDTPGANQGGGAFWISPLNTSVVIDIEASTITNNSAPHTGGGIRRTGATGTVNLRANVIGGNDLVSDTTTARVDMFGNLNLAGYNLIQDTTGYNGTETTDPGTNVLGADPLLGPLAANGGPTQTHALLAGSPAIDEGTCTLISGATLAVDQRGEPRVIPCDIGAYDAGIVVSAPGAPAGSRLRLSSVRPNPVAGTAEVVLTAPAGERVRVDLYDALGRRAATLFTGAATGSDQPLQLDVSGLAAGAYVLRAEGRRAATAVRFTVAR